MNIWFAFLADAGAVTQVWHFLLCVRICNGGALPRAFYPPRDIGLRQLYIANPQRGLENSLKDSYTDAVVLIGLRDMRSFSFGTIFYCVCLLLCVCNIKSLILRNTPLAAWEIYWVWGRVWPRRRKINGRVAQVKEDKQRRGTQHQNEISFKRN